MKNPSNATLELTEEISLLKQRIKELEQSESERKRAEEALRETVDQTRSLFDNMTEGVALHQMVRDGTGKAVNYRILDVNPAYPRQTGITRERARNALASELYGADEPPYLVEYEEVVKSGRPFLFETYFPPLKKHFVVSAMRTNPDHFATLFFDITERKQIEDAQLFLLQSNWAAGDFFESLARYLAETLDMDFVCIDRLEGDGLTARTVAVYFDGKFEDNISYALKDTPCGDVVGKTICSFPRDVRSLFPKDEVLQEMVAEGYMGCTLWSSKGQPIGLIALISRKPLSNPHMVELVLKLVGVRAAGELERRQAEEALKKTSDILSEGQKIAHLGSFEYIADTRTTVWSEEEYRIYGLDPSGPSPSYDVMLAKSIHPDDVDLLHQTFTTAMKNGLAYELEHRIIRPEGSERWVSDRAHPYFDENGNLVRYIGTTLDITERKEAEEHINSLLAEKELLLKEVHHRIKNNMGVITSLLSLQSNTLKDPSAIAALEDAESRVKSMMVLYDKLYRASNFIEVSAAHYFVSLIDEIVENFPNRGLVTIEKHIDDFSLEPTTLSPLGMILNELLTNAMKYAFNGRDKGKIFVSLSAENTHVTLLVWDNGVGIPESIDIAASPGFGLQLVRILTDQIEGTIRLERGKGSTFILEFDL